MKTFISMGMKGKSTEEVREKMHSTFAQIKQQYPHAELIDTIIAEEPPANDNVGMWYLAKSIELLAGADMVFFIDDYLNYRGCQIEYDVASRYGKLCAKFKTE